MTAALDRHGARYAALMLRLACVLWMLLGLVGCASGPAYTPLFNGRDLAGWQGLVADPPKRAAMTPEQLAAAQREADAKMREHWRVVDGEIHFDGKGENLCTVASFGDFEMLLDWQIPHGGDSGVYVRGSPQIQIWDNPIGSGGLFNNKQHPSGPASAADRPVGQWNTFRIRMLGERVWVWLNGTLVVAGVTLENYWERDKPIYARGPIELQAHGGPLKFRRVMVRTDVSEADD